MLRKPHNCDLISLKRNCIVQRMATANTDSSFKDGHGCSICLDNFTFPRQLPCLHSFCEHCLQDYITAKAGSTDTIFKEFMCPVCRAVTMPANKEKPVEEWASLYPHSPFPLVGKSKVERTCEVCSSSSDSSRNLAEKFCIVCDEFMCGNCAICHQKMKMGKSHQMISIEEFANSPQTRMRLREGFGCPEHDNDDIRFYCRSHETACCATCSFLHHKTCEDVLELKHHLPDLLKRMNPQKIIETMRKLEDHLTNFMKMNEESIDIVESHVNNISAEIGDIRKKLNDLIDDIEKKVKLEGSRIYKECLIRKQEQNHQCQSLVSAIINSQALLDTVNQYGSDTQKFMVTTKTLKQLQSYSDRIREKFEIMDNIRIRLKLNNDMKALLSKDAVGLITIAYEEEPKEFQCTSIMIPLEKRSGELSELIDIQCVSTNEPYYFGIVQLPDGYIVLADSSNMTCSLYDTSYNLITSHTLTGNPYGMCIIDDNGVAITMPHKKTVQFLSIRDHSIRDTETLTTKYKCCGIDAVSVEEIVVSGPCGDTYSGTCYWSLITRNGNVKLHHTFECQRTSNAYAALDRSKSRVYISVSGSNAVYCFGLTDGTRYFVYSPNDLVFPLGVSVDREDNIYVVGYSSNNIHKLSSNGDTLQVIASGVPQNPRGISFDYSRHHFVITNGSHANRKLHRFVCK